MTKKTVKLTTADLGLVDDVVLSTKFSNTRKCFKTIGGVIGYYVAGDGNHRSPTRIAPIYDATIWVVDGNSHHTFASYEVGDYLNPRRDDHEEPDRAGDALAHIVGVTLSALATHSVAEAMRPKWFQSTSDRSKAKKRRTTR